MIRRKVRPLHLVLSLCIVAALGVVGMDRAAAVTPSVTASPTSIIAGKSTLVAWNNISSSATPTPTDWIGLYASPGAANTDFLTIHAA